MNKVRLIFDDDFYRLGAVLLSEKYQGLEREFRNKYKELGLSIPSGGFDKQEDYRGWLKKAMRLKNTNDLPGKMIEDILTQFNLDPKNEKYRMGLVWRIFFKKEFDEKFYYLQHPINLILRKHRGSKELWVKVYPWTKKEDYIDLWKEIKSIQPQLKGYRGKEKFQITFKRDFAVYQLYLKTKKLKPKKSIMEDMSAFPEYEPISKLFKDEYFDDYIRSITSRFNKLLAGVNIL
jgi:hypothetical protein